jgi:hypothetical protein
MTAKSIFKKLYSSHFNDDIFLIIVFKIHVRSYFLQTQLYYLADILAIGGQLGLMVLSPYSIL